MQQFHCVVMGSENLTPQKYADALRACILASPAAAQQHVTPYFYVETACVPKPFIPPPPPVVTAPTTSATTKQKTSSSTDAAAIAAVQPAHLNAAVILFSPMRPLSFVRLDSFVNRVLHVPGLKIVLLAVDVEVLGSRAAVRSLSEISRCRPVRAEDVQRYVKMKRRWLSKLDVHQEGLKHRLGAGIHVGRSAATGTASSQQQQRVEDQQDQQQQQRRELVVFIERAKRNRSAVENSLLPGQLGLSGKLADWLLASSLAVANMSKGTDHGNVQHQRGSSSSATGGGAARAEAAAATVTTTTDQIRSNDPDADAEDRKNDDEDEEDHHHLDDNIRSASSMQHRSWNDESWSADWKREEDTARAFFDQQRKLFGAPPPHPSTSSSSSGSNSAAAGGYVSETIKVFSPITKEAPTTTAGAGGGGASFESALAAAAAAASSSSSQQQQQQQQSSAAASSFGEPPPDWLMVSVQGVPPSVAAAASAATTGSSATASSVGRFSRAAVGSGILTSVKSSSVFLSPTTNTASASMFLQQNHLDDDDDDVHSLLDPSLVQERFAFWNPTTGQVSLSVPKEVVEYWGRQRHRRDLQSQEQKGGDGDETRTDAVGNHENVFSSTKAAVAAAAAAPQHLARKAMVVAAEQRAENKREADKQAVQKLQSVQQILTNAERRKRQLELQLQGVKKTLQQNQAVKDDLRKKIYEAEKGLARARMHGCVCKKEQQQQKEKKALSTTTNSSSSTLAAVRLFDPGIEAAWDRLDVLESQATASAWKTSRSKKHEQAILEYEQSGGKQERSRLYFAKFLENQQLRSDLEKISERNAEIQQQIDEVHRNEFLPLRVRCEALQKRKEQLLVEVNQVLSDDMKKSVSPEKYRRMLLLGRKRKRHSGARNYGHVVSGTSSSSSSSSSEDSGSSSSSSSSTSSDDSDDDDDNSHRLFEHAILQLESSLDRINRHFDSLAAHNFNGLPAEDLKRVQGCVSTSLHEVTRQIYHPRHHHHHHVLHRHQRDSSTNNTNYRGHFTSTTSFTSYDDGWIRDFTQQATAAATTMLSGSGTNKNFTSIGDYAAAVQQRKLTVLQVEELLRRQALRSAYSEGVVLFIAACLVQGRNVSQQAVKIARSKRNVMFGGGGSH